MDYQIVMRFGTSNRRGDFHTNTFNIRMAAAIDSPEVVAAVNAIAGAIRPDLVNTAQILSAKVRDITGMGSGYDPSKVRSVGIGLPGQRLTGGNDVEVKLITLNYRLTGTTGRPGGVKLRLLMTDNEVNGGANGNVTPTGQMVDHSGLAARLNAANETANFDWLIVNKKKDQPAVGRVADTWTFVGVGSRSTTAHRRKQTVPKTPQSLGAQIIRNSSGLLTVLSAAESIEGLTGIPAGDLLSAAISAVLPPLRGLKAAGVALKALPQ